jgi:hypothetical protein
MTTDATDWHQALARVTGALVRGEQRVTTHQLLTEHLGIPVTDRACRRLRRVMRELGWRGPQKMRWGERTIQGYWRHPTVGLPAIVRQEPAAEITTIGERTLARELDRVTRLALQKVEQILSIPTDRSDGNLLRAQTVAAATAVNAQLRADETRLREQRSGNNLIPEMLEAIKQERAAALKAADEATAKMKQEQARGPMQEMPQLDVPHEKGDADGAE